MKHAKTDAELLAGLPEYPAGQWVHRKTGNLYDLFTAAYLERDLTLCVVYANADGVPFVRPLDEFREKFQPVPGSERQPVGPGGLTPDQRRRLRAILLDEYRGTLSGGKRLELPGEPIGIPAPAEPPTAFVGYLMANPGLAADVFGYLAEELDMRLMSGAGHDERENRIAAAVRHVIALTNAQPPRDDAP